MESLHLPVAPFSLQLWPLNATGTTTRRRLQSNSGTTAPLFEGLGTHYVFIYVGTPAQRVSVIVDTGSHHTAFPCTGCNCGKHMDPFFNPKLSNSSTICSGSNCRFSQSYSEGSSWEALKVRDTVRIGTENGAIVENGVFFNFGCQVKETGLFRTQNVDGIMGMSASPSTLPFELYAAKLTQTKAFSMCFRRGGGVLSIGGINPSLHKVPLEYAKASILSSGWYSVRLLEIRMRSNAGAASDIKIVAEAKRANGGKGVIVDSGTTDTYLPYFMRNTFESSFQAASGGIRYSTTKMNLTPEQRRNLPTIVFRLATASETFIDVLVPPASYMEKLGASSFVGRIFLTENAGAVLGANVMNGHDVVFDPENKRIGFAESECQFVPNSKLERPSMGPHPPALVARSNIKSEALPNTRSLDQKPLGPCSGRCRYLEITANSSYRTVGVQHWSKGDLLRSTELRNCSLTCTVNHIRVPEFQANCLSTQWTECGENCSRTRIEYSVTSNGTCVGIQRSEQCAVFKCPPSDGDLLLSAELGISGVGKDQWTYYWEESFIETIASLLSVPEGGIFSFIDFIDQRSNPVCILKLRIRFTSALGPPNRMREYANAAFSLFNSDAIGDTLIESLLMRSKDHEYALSTWGWLDADKIRTASLTLQRISLSKGLRMENIRNQAEGRLSEDLYGIGSIVCILLIVYACLYFMYRNKMTSTMKRRLDQ